MRQGKPETVSPTKARPAAPLRPTWIPRELRLLARVAKVLAAVASMLGTSLEVERAGTWVSQEYIQKNPTGTTNPRTATQQCHLKSKMTKVGASAMAATARFTTVWRLSLFMLLSPLMEPPAAVAAMRSPLSSACCCCCSASRAPLAASAWAFRTRSSAICGVLQNVHLLTATGTSTSWTAHWLRLGIHQYVKASSSESAPSPPSC